MWLRSFRLSLVLLATCGSSYSAFSRESRSIAELDVCNDLQYEYRNKCEDDGKAKKKRKKATPRECEALQKQMKAKCDRRDF